MAVTYNPLKEITFTDSPQFVFCNSDGSGGAATTFELDITIWKGAKTPIPTPETRKLILPAVPELGNATSAVFEVASFINKEIDNSFPIPTQFGVPTYNGDNGVWVSMTVQTDTDVELFTGATFFATSGVGLYRDGDNPGTNIVNEDGKVFGSQSPQLVFDHSKDYLVPIYIGDTSQNDVLKTNLGDIDLLGDGYVLNSADSRQQIAYVAFGSSLAGWAPLVQFEYYVDNLVSSIEKQRYYGEVNCFTGRPKSLKYLNRSGTISDFPINGADVETIAASKENFQNLKTFYNIEHHVDKTYRANAVKTIRLESNWVDESCNTMVEDMLTSKRVWYEFNNELFPCQIIRSTQQLINRVYGRAVGYTFNIQLATPELNKVV